MSYQRFKVRFILHFYLAESRFSLIEIITIDTEVNRDSFFEESIETRDDELKN